MIDILKHISIVVLQDVESGIKKEAEGNDDVDIKHEQDLIYQLVRVDKFEKKVKASVLLCMFIYLLVAYSIITAFKSL